MSQPRELRRAATQAFMQSLNQLEIQLAAQAEADLAAQSKANLEDQTVPDQTVQDQTVPKPASMLPHQERQTTIQEWEEAVADIEQFEQRSQES